MKLNLRTVIQAGDPEQLARAVHEQFGADLPARACQLFTDKPGAALAFPTAEGGVGIVKRGGVIARGIRNIPDTVAALLYYEEGDALKSLIFRK